MNFLWTEYIYRPLFNILIILYNSIGVYNMGMAVVFLTVLLRILLLPLTILSEKSKYFYDDLVEKIKEIQKDFPNDVVRQKEEVKKILRSNRFFPWAKFVSLAIQLLVLVIIYQVFLGGINATGKFNLLYGFVRKPDFIQTNFLWFDIGQKDFLLALIVALALFVDITFQQRKKGTLVSNTDVVFRIIFPIITFFILYSLASVKSVFILTSIFFSFIIFTMQYLFGYLLKSAKKSKKKQEAPVDEGPGERLN